MTQEPLRHNESSAEREERGVNSRASETAQQVQAWQKDRLTPEVVLSPPRLKKKTKTTKINEERRFSEEVQSQQSSYQNMKLTKSELKKRHG